MWFFISDFLIIILHFLFGRHYFFNLDFEYNLPSFYSAIKFFFVSFLAWLISRRNKRLAWIILALLFLFLGLDEVLSFHEKYGSIIFYKLFSFSKLASFYSNRLAGFSWYPILFLPAILLFIFLFYFWRREMILFDPLLAKYFLFAIICLILAFILEPIGSLLWFKQSLYQVGMVVEESLELFTSSFLILNLYNINRKF